MEYLPFGETLVDEHLNSYNSPFKFNAKELDPETGNYYYGARYYDPKSSLWLSVDPLAEKYPNFSPYAYTFQNPLNFVDPTGMEGEGWIKGADGTYYFDSRINNQLDVQRYGSEGDKYVGNTYRDDNSFGNPNASNTYGDSSGNQYNSFTNELINTFLDGVEIKVAFLYINRDVDTDNSTTSTFSFRGINGYFLEPAGPDTTTPNQDKRIPEGQYKIVTHNSTKYPNSLKLYNEDVPQSRSILIHSGNKPEHTLGCLLPGSNRGVDNVSGSSAKLKELKTSINEVGVDNVIIIIRNTQTHTQNTLQINNFRP